MFNNNNNNSSSSLLQQLRGLLLIAVAIVIFSLLFYSNDNSNEQQQDQQQRQHVQNNNNNNNNSLLTIRLNTFRRNDLLTASLNHYETCAIVESIQVIWSDQVNQPPPELLHNNNNNNKIKFEMHTTNSLNNRFIPLLPIVTDAVLSIDDDVLVPCRDLAFAVSVWQRSPNALVGFSPRMHVSDVFTGDLRYLRWQHSWWNGCYSIVLTKAALLHKKYLLGYQSYFQEHTIAASPSSSSLQQQREEERKSFLEYVDEKRNCEDIAMAYFIGLKSNEPAVWVKVNAQEIGSTGISSGNAHFDIRSKCLDALTTMQSKQQQQQRQQQERNYFSKKLPLPVGYQKVTRLGFGNNFDFGIHDYFQLHFSQPTTTQSF